LEDKDYRNESHRGWLVNKKRNNRRESDNTLVDSDVLKLINKIENSPRYTQYQDSDIDVLLKLRDEAIIALGWTFFKRGNELLGVKVGQITIVKVDGEDVMQVQFHVQKKQKYIKFCPSCTKKNKPTTNARDANFCRNCGRSLKQVEAQKIGKNYRPVKKIKSLQDVFVKYVLAWQSYAKENADDDDFLFPPYRRWFGFRFGHVDENVKHRKVKVGDKRVFKEIDDSYYRLSIQRLDQILQALDPTMTSSMFRYGHTEVLFREGKDAVTVKQIGDWESTRMPEIYAERKGLTKANKQFAFDVTEGS
jgi:integrase